ncbi:DUF5984 family protein [Croceimicrobium hydrocarbonivorans]|uniref:Uncharacterized protein n=1 Tax=Croceimicrobium hydrocarbonivorans TaxID=2761580 RepID=A0A7H0VDN7_9FLAO|nr:DUF5984 family protein [Croceimicrobium hydrocarbonivorans]QNR23835.1 hypothetical protein H4K34_15875 [Croceimicrobium hydrocarbonivorans]
MINFKLKDTKSYKPVGSSTGLSMSWYWLTEGDLWIDLGDSSLYEYSPKAQEYFGGLKSQYNEYQIIRFIEDFTALFEVISESIPNDIYRLAENSAKFLQDAQKWLDLNDAEEDQQDDFYFEKYDKLISWINRRSLDSGHLVGGPKLSFFRNKDKIRVTWQADYKLENGIDLWTAGEGSIEFSYSEFINDVKDFGDRFFKQMQEQVDLAVEKEWNGIQIDKQRLLAEHSEREIDFWKQFKLLKGKSPSETKWELIRELKSQMDEEIKRKA